MQKNNNPHTNSWWNNIFHLIAVKMNFKRPTLPSLHDVLDITRIEKNEYHSIRTIEVDKIIGSEGRYADFEKNFLPRNSNLNQRLENIRKLSNQGHIFPPISVYKIDEYYFVRDGNHRVSIAKSSGQKYIEADVLELKLNVPITKDLTLVDRILIEENSNFAELTKLGQRGPSANILLTSPGMYQELLKIIKAHNELRDLGSDEESFIIGAEKWYENVFTPFAEDACNNDLLSKFPGRTTGDLYLWAQLNWEEINNTTHEYDYLADTETGLEFEPNGYFSSKELKILNEVFTIPRTHEINFIYSKSIGICVCCVLFHINQDDQIHIILVKRKYHPYERQWTLPISMLRVDERIEEAADRCQMNVLGLKKPAPMRMVSLKDNVDRHPFGRSLATVMVGFLLDKKTELELKPGHLASEVLLSDLDEVPQLVYDHNAMVIDTLKYIYDNSDNLRHLIPILPAEMSLERTNRIIKHIENNAK